jgi:hypothetical protein
VLGRDVETVRPREVFEPLAGTDVVNSDDRAPALVVPPQRGRDDDRQAPSGAGPVWRI